jgi:Spy/CpxP family protein refolding chaperone
LPRIHPIHDGGEQGPADYIIKQLKLDDKQQQQFTELRKQHHDRMRKTHEKDKELHDLYFSLLKIDNPDKNKVDSIAILIGEQRKIMATVTFDHFQQLRAICNTDQKKLFDETINDILEMMAGHGGEGPPH